MVPLDAVLMEDLARRVCLQDVLMATAIRRPR